MQNRTDPICLVAYISDFPTMAEFNRTCPACGDHHGTPRVVTASRGKFTVKLACDKCGNEWTTERKPDVQLFQSRHHELLQGP